MDSATQQRLIDRVLALAAAGMPDMEPRTTQLPVATYTDPGRLAAEQQALFRGRPLIVARSDELPRPGTFLTRQAGDVPLLLTRDEAGTLHALINVCRHRGMRVCGDESGARARFACPYHAWTYDLAGCLVRISDAAGFDGIDPAHRGLVALPATERHGFVWVVLQPGAPVPDIASALDALDGDFERLGLDRHVRHEPTTFAVAMNWKLAIDIFLEAYHVRYAHVRSIAPLFFDNLGVFERCGPHQRNLFPKRSIEELRNTDRATWQLRPHCNVLYQVFPNTLMLVQADHCSMFHAWPDGLARTQIVAYQLLPEAPASDKARSHWQKNVDILFNAVREDIAMGEAIQRGFSSGANDAVVFGRYEQSLTWFHDAVRAALA